MAQGVSHKNSLKFRRNRAWEVPQIQICCLEPGCTPLPIWSQVCRLGCHVTQILYIVIVSHGRLSVVMLHLEIIKPTLLCCQFLWNSFQSFLNLEYSLLLGVQENHLVRGRANYWGNGLWIEKEIVQDLGCNVAVIVSIHLGVLTLFPTNI